MLAADRRPRTCVRVPRRSLGSRRPAPRPRHPAAGSTRRAIVGEWPAGTPERERSERVAAGGTGVQRVCQVAEPPRGTHASRAMVATAPPRHRVIEFEQHIRLRLPEWERHQLFQPQFRRRFRQSKHVGPARGVVPAAVFVRLESRPSHAVSATSSSVSQPNQVSAAALRERMSRTACDARSAAAAASVREPAVGR